MSDERPGHTDQQEPVDPAPGATAAEEVPPRATSVPSRERWRTFGAPALAAVTIAALCLGTLLGYLVFAPRHPGDSSAEAGFARDMSEHHAQAVQMSTLVMQRTEDEQIRRLATDIVNNQEFERGVMATWLSEWGLPRAREGERMAWMSGHEHDVTDLPAGVAMPGMATPAEIQQLTDSSGQEAEVLFLQLMTTHHLAGVQMAQAALDEAADADVLAAAGRMVSAQTGEVSLMQELLADRDAEPREDVDAWIAEHGEGASTDDATTTGDGGGHDH